MTHIIAIGGPSCAGKTELAKSLSRALQTAILPLDAYYRDLSFMPIESRTRFNFDIPESFDHTLLKEHLTELAAGKPIHRPVYDWKVHTRSPIRETLTPGDFVIFEGLFALHWEDLRPLMKSKVYVDAPDTICLSRRQARDVLERGRTVESVYKQYVETVRPMAELYVRPSRRFADIVISGETPIQQSTAQVLAHLSAEQPTTMPASGATSL